VIRAYRPITPLFYAGGLLLAVLLAGLMLVSPFAGLALVFAALVVTLAWLRPFYLLLLLILGLPFHVFASRAMVGLFNVSQGTVEMFAYWKEGVMALLIGVLLLRRLFGQDRFKVKLYPFDLGLACIALLMGAYIFVGPLLNVGIYGFRNYLEPLVVFYLLRAVPVSARQLRFLVLAMLGVSVVMALIGIYQVAFWNFNDLYNWGFREADGTIPNAFYTAEVERQPHLRAIGTVTSPNELGLMLVLAIAIALVFALQPQRALWQRAILLAVTGICGVAVLLTYSRSSLVGLLSMVAALAVLEIGFRNLGQALRYALRSPGTILALLALAALLVVGAERVGLVARITRALNMNDPSAVGHLASYEASIPFILDHPLGIGTGMAGPRALKFSDKVKIEHVESSWLQMMMEIGILGALFTLGIYLMMVWTLRAERQRWGGGHGSSLLARALPGAALGSLPVAPASSGAPTAAVLDPFFDAVSIAAQAAWLGAMVAFTFLPLMQELQLMSYLWIAAAIPLVAVRER
jgi:hypothetical protein